MQHIKCDQRVQSLGQKALRDHDCTFYPFGDQCQEVTAGKSAEQRHRRGRGREEQTLNPGVVLVTPGLISVSTQKHSAPPGHQAYFALPLFPLSILLTYPTPLSYFTPQPLWSLSSFSIYDFPSPLSWLVYLIFLFLITKWLFPKLMLIYIHTSIYKNMPVSLYSHKN